MLRPVTNITEQMFKLRENTKQIKKEMDTNIDKGNQTGRNY